MQMTLSTVAVAGLAVLVLGLAPRADADEGAGANAAGPVEEAQAKACSDRTLSGDYAFVIDGTILTGPSPALLRGLAMTRFDGEGNLSQVDFTTRNGIPVGTDWSPATGTYSLGPDCTGQAEIHFTDGRPVLRLRLVVADRGREVLTVVLGNPTGSRGVKVR
jgi:hypothetical protein